MGGVGADGMTRYMPNQDLLTFANQDRAREDQRISDIIGSGTNYRDPLKAMTPSEIQFYRHKMNMLTNPAYANRVNTQRADRQEMLDNRRDMVRARREGALEAAGESQQMRNLMAGRGAVGGNSALGALLGMASLQDPNEALRGFSQATMANQSPGMLRDRLIAEENMLATRAALGRMQQYENMRMQIIGSGMPEIERQRALQSLNNSILSSQGGVPTNGGMNTFTSGSGTVNGIPNWLPLPEAFPDGNVPTVQRMAEYMQGLRSDPRWQNLPPDQQSAILSQIQSQYFPGIRESDRQQYLQDNATGLLSRLLNWGRGLFGMDEANMTRRQEALDAIAPYRAGSAPYQPGQRELTEDERRAVNEMPDSRDRILYENLLRDPSFRNYMQPSMQFPY